MPPRQKLDVAAKLIEEWTLPSAATLGSSVRAKGIALEVRAHLPLATKKLLGLEVGVLILRMPEGTDDDFRSASAIVSKTLEGIEGLPVIPREIEDILTISVGRAASMAQGRPLAKRWDAYGETSWTR